MQLLPPGRRAAGLVAVFVSLGLGVGWLSGGAETVRAAEPATVPVKAEPIKTGAAKAEPMVADPVREPIAPVVTTPGTGAKIRPRYVYKAGETVYFEVEHRVEFDTTVNGHSQKASTFSKSLKAWKVLEVDAKDNVTIENSVLKVLMWQELTGRARSTFDSEDAGPAPAGFETIAASLNTPLSVVKFDCWGRVLNREIKFRGQGNQADSGAEINLPLPADGIAVGGIWEIPFPLKVDVDKGLSRVLQARNRFALAKLEDEIAVIDFEMQVLTPVNDPQIQAALVQRGGRGQLRFDTAKGRPIETLREVDETVVGFRGPASSLRFVSKFTERLVPAPAKTASKPKPTE